jgi:hypothetical protein
MYFVLDIDEKKRSKTKYFFLPTYTDFFCLGSNKQEYIFSFFLA